MPLILQTPTNPGEAQFTDAAITTGQPQTFVFAPGTTTEGNNFATWAELYTAYRVAVAANPNLSRKIVLDNRGLPAGTAVTIPSVPGNPPQVFESRTSFAAPVSEDDRVVGEVDSDVIWEVDKDPSGDFWQFETTGINWVRKPGATDPWISPSAPSPSSFVLRAKKGSMINDSTIPAIRHPAPLAAPAASTRMEVDEHDFLVGASGGKILSLSGGLTHSLVLRAKSAVIKGRVLESSSTLTAVDSEVDADTQVGNQDDLLLPDGGALNGPAASANVRPGRSIVILTTAQLNLFGPFSNPQILQAFLFTFTTNPSPGDTLSITDGTVTETFTFVAGPPGPFDVSIAGTAAGTLQNLAISIGPASTLWKGALVQNPQTLARAVAIIRKIQLKENYPDRAFGSFVTGAFVSGFTTPQGTVLLSYSSPVTVALPAADPGFGVAGFATAAPVLDGFLVSVLDNFTDGIYQGKNAIGTGSGTWSYLGGTIDPTFTIPPGGGTFLLTRSTRNVLAALAGADVTTIVPAQAFQEGERLVIRRADAAGGASLSFTPVPPATVNGAASLPIAVTSGVVLFKDGAGDWWSAP